MNRLTESDRAITELEVVSRCVFCGSDERRAVLADVEDLFFKADPGRFGYVTCGDCGSLWLENRPTGDRLLQAYASYYTHETPTDNNPSMIRRLVRTVYLRSRLAQQKGFLDRILIGLGRAILPDNPGLDHHYRFSPTAPARVLDYGCGSGDYLLRLAPYGHRLAGVEYDPALLSALSGRGIQIEDVLSVAKLPWSAKFDHISLAHVIEHVPDPLELLGRLYDFLRPGGTLFIEVPNAEATGLQIFGKYWRGLEAPRHFSLPNRESLITALENAGFVIERQHIDICARGWVWSESLSAAQAAEIEGLQCAMRLAPPETETNAEFLTFVARKQA